MMFTWIYVYVRVCVCVLFFREGHEKKKKHLIRNVK